MQRMLGIQSGAWHARPGIRREPEARQETPAAEKETASTQPTTP